VLFGGVAAAVVVVAAIAAVVVFVMHGKGANPPATPSAAPAGPPMVDALNCKSYRSDTTTTGNGPGDTASGTGAIFGFEHAFYTDRSAQKAESFTVPGKIDVNQQVIDQYPKGTTYCLSVTELTQTTYHVIIAEHQPDGKSPVYDGVIDVASVDGKFLVARPQHN
jgi:hypothetical protein